MQKKQSFISKNKSLISLIAALCIIAAVVIVPRVTGSSLGEWVNKLFGGEEISQTASEETSNSASAAESRAEEVSSAAQSIDENGEYTSKDDVALYIHTYGKLPKNFITKSQAQSLGWESGPLWEFAPGKSIGGDTFGNREGLLPKASGRKWYECDIDYDGGSRGAKRIVFSNDGLIYYTDDHYESFTRLY